MPLAVVWGVFLFLGLKVMAGNQFLARAAALLLDATRLDPTNAVERSIVELGRKRVLRFTGVQCGCLAALWLLKLNKATAMVFPSVIGVLLVLRAALLGAAALVAYRVARWAYKRLLTLGAMSPLPYGENCSAGDDVSRLGLFDDVVLDSPLARARKPETRA